MRRTLSFASAAFFTLLLPLTAVPAAAELGPDQVELMGVFAEQPTVSFLQPSLAIDDPAGKKASMCDAAAACKGPVTAPLAFVDAVNPLGQDFKVTTNIIGTMFVSADQPILVQAMRIELVINNVATVIGHNPQATGPVGYVFTDGDGTPAQLTTAPTKFSFAAAPPPNSVKADHKIGLRVYMSAVGLGRPASQVPDGTSPVNIYVHFGSAQYPTGVVFGTSVSPGDSTYGCAVSVSLTDTALSFAPPMATESLARLVEFGGPTPPPIGAVSATEFDWGSLAADRAYTFLSDAEFSITLRLPASATGAAPMLGLTANLYLGAQKLNASTSAYDVKIYNNANAAVGPAAPVKFLLAMPTGGKGVAAGDTMRLTLQIYQVSGAVNDFEVLYGSTADPSGFLMAVPTAECSGAPAVTLPAQPEETPAEEPLDEETDDSTDEETVEEEPETVVDGEGAGTAKEANVKDVGIPADVPAPSGFLVLVVGLALALVVRRRRA